MLFTRDAIILQRKAYELLVLEGADEEASAPRRHRAAVELRARGRNHRVPVVDRLFVAITRGHGARNRHAGILLAIRDERPAVVLALLDEVHLVAAPRPVLDHPEPSVGIERRGLHVAVTQRPDLRPGVPAID